MNLKIDGVYIFDKGVDEKYTRTFFYLFRNGVCFVAGYGATTEESKKKTEDIFFNQGKLTQMAPLN